MLKILKLYSSMLVIAIIILATAILYSATPYDVWRPLIGGIQIGVWDGQKLTGVSTGFPAYYNYYDIYYYIGFVTTGHAGDAGDYVYQPADGDLVGSIYSSSLNYGDVAFVVTETDSWYPDPDTVEAKIYYSYNSNNYVYIDGYWSGKDLEYKIGSTLYKSGYKTSTTTGELKRVINNWYYSNLGIFYKYAIIMDIYVEQGDSGGTVFYREYVPGEGEYFWIVGIVSQYYYESGTKLVICASVDDAISYLGVEPIAS